jgi:hypothetical protein
VRTCSWSLTSETLKGTGWEEDEYGESPSLCFADEAARDRGSRRMKMMVTVGDGGGGS